MRKASLTGFAVAFLALAGCETTAPDTQPEPPQQTRHEMACTAGQIAGILIGGALGAQFGGGRGADLLTIAGGAAGGVTGNRLAC